MLSWIGLPNLGPSYKFFLLGSSKLNTFDTKYKFIYKNSKYEPINLKYNEFNAMNYRNWTNKRVLNHRYAPDFNSYIPREYVYKGTNLFGTT